jgi:hypothetical protein
MTGKNKKEKNSPALAVNRAGFEGRKADVSAKSADSGSASITLDQSEKHSKKLQRTLEKVNRKHGRTLRNLAD